MLLISYDCHCMISWSIWKINCQFDSKLWLYLEPELSDISIEEMASLGSPQSEQPQPQQQQQSNNRKVPFDLQGK